MNDNFNAKDYWKSFEILSVKIVKIQIQEILEYKDEDIFETEIPLTRDHGIDGQLKIVLNGNDIVITIEAKLRTKGTLGLKEFASSLVNYFINLSDIHFVVTNVEFSDDSKKILASVNQRNTKNCLNYIDGAHIQNFLSKRNINDIPPEHKQKINELIAYIMKQKFSKSTEEKENARYTFGKKIKESNYILGSQKKAIQDITNLLKRSRCFLIIEGDLGVGKSYIINQVLNNFKQHTSVISLDLSSDWSNQTLVIEILKNMLHMDFSQLFNLLSYDDKQEINKILSSRESFSKDYIIALKQVLMFDSSEKLHYNYLIKTFFKTILENTQLSFFIYLFNCSEISLQTSNFFLNLLPEIAEKVNIIIEVDSAPIIVNETDTFNQFIKSIRQYCHKGLTVSTYQMYECNKTEAKEYIQNSLPFKYSNDVIEYICSRYGCNLSILTDVIDYINKNGITTRVEISRMPLIQYGSFTENTFKQYIMSLSAKSQRVLLWGAVIVEEMNGCLDYLLVEKLEEYFKVKNAIYIFLKSSFFDEFEDKLVIKNIICQKILVKQVSNYDKRQVFKFLLTCMDCWRLSELQRQYKEYCFRLFLKDKTTLLEIDSLIEILGKQNLNLQKRNLLYMSYQLHQEIVSDKIHELIYLVRYLESLVEELKYCDSKHSELLDRADILCKSLINKSEEINLLNLYELQIRIYFLYYNQQKSLFRFDLAEIFIDKALSLEIYCQDIELIGKMYWCKGLCLKERGFKPNFLTVMLRGIKKYPNAMYLKICYLSNYASSNFKTDLNKSYKALKVGVKLARRHSFIDLEVWLSNNIILCDLIRKKFDKEILEHILQLRQKADKYELLSDISRSYNNEAIWHWNNGHNNDAIDCLEHALNIFNESVTDQQKFLFRTNKILLLSKSENKINMEINIIYDWLKQNYLLMKNKLNNVTEIKKENNYAAILSLYRTSYLSGEKWFCKKLIEWFDYHVFDNVTNGINSDIIDSSFIVNQEIFILF